MYYLYILFSTQYKYYYVGYTSDYRKRLIQHNTQDLFNTYTSKYRPWQLAAVFECGLEENEAIRLERFIKKQKSRKLIELLINPRFTPEDSLAQLVRVPHVRD